MGMYDNVFYDGLLPDGLEGHHAFQTKDLECQLDDYRIDHLTGRLYHEVVLYEANPDYTEPPPLPPDPKLADRLARLWDLGQATRVRSRDWFDVNYHGWLNFYCSVDTGTTRRVEREGGESFVQPVYEHHDYRAKFTDGVLQHIEVVPEPRC